MSRMMRLEALAFAFSCCALGTAVAQTSNQAEMRSLDEQVQEVKSDVLAIARDLSLLEERLLYPSNTELSLFVGMEADASFRLDSVRIEVDGVPVAHYIYSFKELEALQNGGLQRIYTGNVVTGGHDLVVEVSGKLDSGREVTASDSFSFSKGVEPQLLGLTLTAAGGSVDIAMGDW